VEQVKGINYKLDHFLGQQKDPTGVSLEPAGCTKQEPCVPAKCLYQCVLYLAPGDYHCFHSPVDWVVTTRRHFPGELLSVNPGIVRKIEGLFSINERVAYLGRWQHGFFSMTAVGATNVGSVKVGLDPDLTTNTRKWELDTFHQKIWQNGFVAKKGEYFGEFNLGSTIVLIFEAPDNFEFNFGIEGGVVKMGKSIGEIETEKVIGDIEPAEKVIRDIEPSEEVEAIEPSETEKVDSLEPIEEKLLNSVAQQC